MDTNHIRTQRKGQSARQAMMISGLNTIYRNNSSTHNIQSKQRTEPRIYFLDITLDEINQQFPKIHTIIERGRLRPKGTEIFFVTTKLEHFIFADNAIYEIRTDGQRHDNDTTLYEYHPIDGATTTIEVTPNVPILLDESYYTIQSNEETTKYRSVISSRHIVTRRVKMVVKTHYNSMNAFVFILNEDENTVLDFYMTTENGVNITRDKSIMESTVADKGNDDRLTRTCKEDIISFIDHFKLCS